MLKRVRRHFYFYGAWFFSKLVLLFPYKWSVGFAADFFGKIAPHFTRDASSIAMDNLKKSFPQKTPKQIKEIIQKVFINQAKNFFELANFPKITPEFLTQISHVENAALIKESIEKKKGILFVSAHCGNWEITAAAIAALGIPVNAVAKKIYVDELNDMLVGYRTQKNVGVILRESKDSARKLLRALKNGEIIAMLIDQDTNVPGVFVDFFGRKAWTPSGLASLALRTGATVLIGIDQRLDDFKHKTVVMGPVEISRTDDLSQDIASLTQKATSLLESHIAKYPEQWVWFHKRWQTKPEDEQAEQSV
jgi:KDO2-lipid IV(A) lauroyltransferase